jgi:hypothetical protein
MKELNTNEIEGKPSLSMLSPKQKKQIHSEACFCLWLSELMSKSLGRFIENTPLDGDVFSIADEMINCFAIHKEEDGIIIGLPYEMSKWFTFIQLQKCTVVKDKLYISLIVEDDAFFIAFPVNGEMEQLRDVSRCSFGVIKNEAILPIAESLQIPFSVKSMPLNLV